MVNPGRIILRNYGPADTGKLIDLFRTTVQTVNTADYSPDQIAAWVPETIDATAWHHRFFKNYTVVAETRNQIAGFSELTDQGLVHMLYVSAAYQRQGIASALLRLLEQEASRRALTRLTTFASVTAEGFFARSGFQVIRPNKVTIGDQVLDNYLMEKKQLSEPPSVD